MAILLKCGFALFFGRRLVVGDVGHVAFFLVTVVAFDGSVVDCFFHLKKVKKCSSSDTTCGFDWNLHLEIKFNYGEEKITGV